MSGAADTTVSPTTAELVDTLRKRGVELWAEGGRLRFRAPHGALTPELKERLRDAKAEVLALLAEAEARLEGEGKSQGESKSEGEGVAVTPLEIVPAPDERFEPFSMTDLQQAYWIGQSDAIELGDMPARGYSEVIWTDLDVARLETAWNRLIERHDMLRVVVLEDGRLRVLEEVETYEIPEIDFRGRPAGEVEAAIEAMRREMVGRPLEVETWPPFEMRVSRQDDGRTLLHWSNSLLTTDDLSYHALSDELYRLYETPDAELPALEIGFRDVLVALEKFRRSAAYGRSLDYWRAQLPAMPPAPELPLARPGEDAERQRFRRLTARTHPDSWDTFRRRSQAIGVTPAAALCAVYAEVLANWSRHPRFTLNLLFFNRPPLHPQIERIVGNFTSTILLEVDASPGLPFAERARAVQKRLWQNQEHSRVSGVQVLRELHRLQAGGGHGRAAFPVVYAANMGLGTSGRDSSGGSSVTAKERPYGIFGLLHTPQVLLDQQVHVLGGVMSFNWDGAERFLAAGILEEMFDAYCRLYDLLASPDESAWQAVGRRLTPAEHLAVVTEANATTTDLGPGAGRLMHELFAEQAAETPEATAVVSADRRLTYDELLRRARRLGRHLRQLGARPETLVAIVMDKGWQQVVAALGILESGAAYLPVDAGLPPERRSHLLARGEVEIVLTEARLESEIAWPTELGVLAVDAAELEPGAAEPPLEPAQKPDDLAYVIFTSGSTGEPKGVMIDHRAVVNTLLDIHRRFDVGPDDRAFALSSLSFDLSVWDVFGLLSSGGAVVIPGRDELREPRRWAETLEREKVTIWNSVPALMQMLTDHLAGRGEHLPASLRRVMMSGDWIPLALPEAIRGVAAPRRPDGPEIVSLGGATEASIWSILHPIGEVEPHWTSVPYGRAMWNQSFHVLDEDLEPRPLWVPGELYIGGVGLARGYWRDAAKTAAAFLRHPETGERLYRTGDLGRYLQDGTIEFLGREDLQVKIQGYRIELGEIEAALGEHPGIEAAYVVAVGEKLGSKQLVAWVVPGAETGAETETLPEIETLRRHLRAKLPEYMVPATFAPLDEPPLTANGKVDRGALVVRGVPGNDRGDSGRAPRDDLERRLVELWEELLERRPIGIGDDFFAAGGHSLLAVRLMARIRQTFGRDLPLSALLDGATVEALAAKLRDGDEVSDGTGSPLVAIRAEGDGRPLVLVHPVGGNVLCYSELGRELGRVLSKRPLDGLERRDAEDIRLEDLAARYCEALHRAGRHGPHVLGGWSMGGTIAYEMARQLQAAGEEVCAVAMIDAPAPHESEAPAMDEAELMAWFARDLAGLSAETTRLGVDELRAAGPGGRLERLATWARASGLLPAEVEREEIARLFAIFQANARALEAYVPASWPGRIILFDAADRGVEGRRGADAWSRLAGESERFEVAADHYTVVRQPAVREVVRNLEHLLEHLLGAETSS